MDIKKCLQKVRKEGLKTFSYLAFLATFLVFNLSSLFAGQHSSPCCSTGCKSKGINQHLMDKHHGTLVLSKSGSYHLEQDVKGTIYIESSNVCLDLCCHTLNAKGHNNAIVVGDSLTQNAKPTQAHGQLPSVSTLQMIYTKEAAIAEFCQKEVTKSTNRAAKPRQLTLKNKAKKKCKARSAVHPENVHHVRISNGSVVGATQDAISVHSVFDIAIFNLTMQKNALNSIHILDSNAVSVHDITFFGGGATPNGERALLMESTDNFELKNLVVTGYTCTLGSAIELEGCHTGFVEDADVSLNICQPSQQVSFEPLGSFVTLSGCTEVTLEKVKVNKNVYKDLGITFCGIYLLESTNCSILDSEVCSNVDESTAEDASFDGLFFLFSNNCNVNGYKFNENRTINYRNFEFCGIVYCNSAYALCENVQINGNIAENISWFNMHGIWTINFFDGSPTREITMKNCEVLNNITNGSSDGLTSYIGIRVNSTDNILENCRMNNNKGFTDATQFIQGFACSGGTGVVKIADSQANYNDAPDVTDYSAFPGAVAASVGFNLHSGTVEMSNCSASYNGNAGILTYGNIYIQCDNCVFNRNGTLTEKTIAAGMAIGVPAFGSSGNIVVRNCILQQNGTPDLNEEGYGVYVNPGSNNSILIENTDILETRGSRVAAGIFADAVRDVVLNNVTVRSTSGVPLVTDCTGIHLTTVENLIIKNSSVMSTGSVVSDSPTASGVGIKLENVDVFEISETTSSLNANEGFLLIDSSRGVVQESKALSNGADGFSDNQADLSLINIYIENVASKNNPNFTVGVNTMIDNISQG